MLPREAADNKYRWPFVNKTCFVTSPQFQWLKHECESSTDRKKNTGKRDEGKAKRDKHNVWFKCVSTQGARMKRINFEPPREQRVLPISKMTELP